MDRRRVPDARRAITAAQLSSKSELTMTKNQISRAPFQVLYKNGEALADGRLAVSPEEFISGVLALDVFRPKGGDEKDDEAGPDDDSDYDPVKVGKEMAAKEKNASERARRDAFR